jgi:hypothetical protein
MTHGDKRDTAAVHRFAELFLREFRGAALVQASWYPSGGSHFLTLKLLPEHPPNGCRNPSCWVYAYEDWLLVAPDGEVVRPGDSDEMDLPGFQPVIGSDVVATSLRSRDLGLSLHFATGHTFVVPMLAPRVEAFEDGEGGGWELAGATGLEVVADAEGLEVSWPGTDARLEDAVIAGLTSKVHAAFWLMDKGDELR